MGFIQQEAGILLDEVGVPLDRVSDDNKRLCREMLKARIRVTVKLPLSSQSIPMSSTERHKGFLKLICTALGGGLIVNSRQVFRIFMRGLLGLIEEAARIVAKSH